ncbi:MAG TPA: universal stress protein [Acidimicrobiales bacterium]|nr:universal stress protein [Acidimicrobiales bacterium]
MYRTIVVGTDGSRTAHNAVSHAVELARLTGATLHVVSARQPAMGLAGAAELGATGLDPGTAAAEASAAAIQEAVAEAESAKVPVETHDPAGSAAACLIEIAKTAAADLIVVGSRGMHGARRVLGSTPNTVTHQAGCHVLVVHTA